MNKSRENNIDIPSDNVPQGAVPDSTGVPESAVPEDPAPGAGAPVGGVPMEPSVEAIKRLEGELDQFRDRHARLAAEFDNYRKRVIRENHVLVERAQAGLAIKVLDVLDDLDRILDNMDETTPSESLREAIELVDRKLRKELESAGLQRLDPAGTPFDPTLHEAVATAPSPDAAKDDHVSATFQAGYLFKGALIRPARVQVFSDQGQG
jgi:molecular chaperone GrpE